jgi:hypothetical protein
VGPNQQKHMMATNERAVVITQKDLAW